jgi:putative DNA primase/helicase
MPDCLRIHPALIYWTKHPQLGWIEDGQYPAMIAKVVAADGQMVAVHKTYLTSDGRKVAIPAAKKLSKALYRGALNGAAIRLFHAGETLAVAEGIETALAVHLLGDLPVWSTITANGMERLTVPVHTKKLIIAADNDASGRGLQAAQRLADRYASTKEVKIITPPQPGTDWADVLLDEASNHGST